MLHLNHKKFLLKILETDHISEKVFSMIDTYIKMIMKYNQKVNLISRKEQSYDTVFYRHFMDSVIPYKHFDKSSLIIDIGTGAGFPGIPLYILLNKPVILIESKTKKTDFLKNVIKEICKYQTDLSACTHPPVYMINKNINETKKKDITSLFKKENHAKVFQNPAITCRAFRSTNQIVKLIQKLRSFSPEIILYKGTKDTVEEEINNVKKETDLKIFTYKYQFKEYGERHMIKFHLS